MAASPRIPCASHTAPMPFFGSIREARRILMRLRSLLEFDTFEGFNPYRLERRVRKSHGRTASSLTAGRTPPHVCPPLPSF
jgi:hypothetical protein